MVAIIGGGISGLAAAYELTKRNLPFTLFEASERLGGLIRTEHVDGFTIEAGADSMLVNKRAGLDLCEELGLKSRLLTMREPRAAFVLHRDRLHRLPTPGVLGIPATWKGIATYRLLSPGARLRLALEPLIRTRRAAGDESIAAFFGRRFGAETIDRIAQPLLGGIHAGDVRALSAPALLPRLVERERSGRAIVPLIRESIRAVRPGGGFRSLTGGMNDLVDAIRRRIPEHALRCGLPVRALRPTATGFALTAGAEVVSVRAVILACPAYAAAALIAGLDGAAADLCQRVRYASTVSVALAWPREAVGHPLRGSGFVVAQTNAIRITACTWVSSKWTNRAPADSVLLRAYLGGARDPSAVDLSDDEIVRISVGELSTILSITRTPALARVYRWRNAGAQHEVGHHHRIHQLESRLQRLPGIFVAGSGFHSIGLPDCIADGRAIAARAESFCHDA